MAELFAKIILGGSLIGIGTILVRKIPILVKIPEKEIEEFDLKTLFLKFKTRIESSKIFSPDLVSQKLLSKIRILTLRIGRKTEDQLQKIREKSKRKNDRKNDNYWEELKNVKNQNKEKD